MRNKSLILLGADAGILLCGLGILLLRQYPAADYSVLPWALGAIGAAFGVQCFLIKGKYTDDVWLLPIVMFFASIGVVMLGRLKPVLCIPQLRWLLIGLAVLLLVLQFSRKIRELMQYQYILGILTGVRQDSAGAVPGGVPFGSQGYSSGFRQEVFPAAAAAPSFYCAPFVHLGHGDIDVRGAA